MKLTRRKLRIFRKFLEKSRQIKQEYPNYNVFKAIISSKYRRFYYKKFDNRNNKYYIQIAKERGYLLSPNSPPDLFKEILIERIYDVKGFTPKENDVVVDVGAYYGDSAIWWAKEFRAKVIAFEPLKKAYKEMLKNIKLNHVERLIKAYNVALGSGKTILGGTNKGTMFGITSKERKIKTKTLDSFNLRKVDILKIDVEGFEYDVLLGAIETIKRTKPKIILEAHSKELRRECEEILKSLNYELKVEGRKVESNSPGFDTVQNLFYEFCRS